MPDVTGSLVLLVIRFGTLPEANFFEDFLDPTLFFLIRGHDDMSHLIERVTIVVERIVVNPEVAVLFRVTPTELKPLEEFVEVFWLIVMVWTVIKPEVEEDDGRTCTSFVENIYIHSVSFVLITLRRLLHRS